jgi:hypothetical protein
MVAVSALVLGNFSEAIEHATAARDLAIETEKPRLGGFALYTETLAHFLAGDFPGALAAAARREQFRGGGKWTSSLFIASAAAAAMASPDEKTLREELVETEAGPADIAAADFLAAVYGFRESESSYHAVRSAGYPKGIVDQTLIGPVVVLAAARWRIDDEAFEDRIAGVIERTGHARGRALLVHAEGLRAGRRGELAKAETLLFDAVQAFATLRLDYERAVALADHARVAAALGHGDPAAEFEEAKQIAERLGAVALRVATEQVAVAS